MSQESEQARDPAAFPVPLSTIEYAARFLKRISLHALALYLNRSSGSEAYTIAREAGRAILARNWLTVARRNLIQGVRAFRNAAPELQDAAVRLLVDMGWLGEAKGGYMKPTPARYTVNPKLLPKFAAMLLARVGVEELGTENSSKFGPTRASNNYNIRWQLK